jgi:hypothetical protein
VKVRVRIAARAAILARRALAGIAEVTVTDEDLKDLSDALLEELAAVAETDEVLEGPLVSDASFGSVRAVLEERVAAKDAAKAANAEAAAKQAEETVTRDRETSERDRARTRALRAWVEENGSEDQRSRQKEGFLPDEEIIEEVTDALFEIDEDEYVALTKMQACDCDRGCAGSVVFTVGAPVGGLDSRQYAVLEKIRELAPKGATVTPRMHKAACPLCPCTPIARLSALVSLPWCGWLLVKEYSLG